LVGATPVWAVSPPLAVARSEFAHNEWKKVVDSLAPALAQSRISDGEELKEAHYLLGTSYYFLDRPDLARQEFTSLLFLDPTRELDPAIDDARVYIFFKNLKTELRQRLEEINRLQQRDAALRKQLPREVLIERTIHAPAPAVSNFVPFGYGQFRNGQTGKGMFFLIAELLTAGTSIALASYEITTYGLPAKLKSTDDADAINRLTIAQVVSGGLFFGLYAIGTWDSFASRPPEIEEKRSERPITPTPPAPPPRTSGLHLVPLIAPQAVGMGAEWRF